jgi:hypothetical protein
MRIMGRRTFVGIFSAWGALMALLYAGCGDDSTSTGPTDTDACGCVDVSPRDGGPDGTPNETDASDAATADVVVDAGFDPCANDKDGGLFTHLSCTGLYSDIASKTVNANAKPFAPGVAAWMDGATMKRYISIPAGTKIDSTDMDNWSFPVGTTAWQELSLAGKRIETRYMTKTKATSWDRMTFVWDDTESDAVRLDIGETIDGGYEVPNKNLCAGCHDGASDQLLGFEAVSLGLSTATGLTLDQLKTQALLTSPPIVTTVTIPDDATNKAAPALTWLHGNCGNACHNDRANAGAMFTGQYLRIRASYVVGDGGAPTPVSQMDSYKTTVGVAMSVDDAGAGTTLRIASGDAVHSGIVVLAGNRTTPVSTDQMPPILTHQVDTTDLQLVKDWINAGP